MKRAINMFESMYPQFAKRFNKRHSISKDIKLYQTYIKRRELDLKNSKQVGEFVWEDDDKTPLDQLSRSSKKAAARVRQNKHRIEEEYRKRFGRKLV